MIKDDHNLSNTDRVRINEFSGLYTAAYIKRFPNAWGFSMDRKYYDALQEYLDALWQAERRIDLVVARMEDHTAPEGIKELEGWENYGGLRK